MHMNMHRRTVDALLAHRGFHLRTPRWTVVCQCVCDCVCEYMCIHVHVYTCLCAYVGDEACHLTQHKILLLAMTHEFCPACVYVPCTYEINHTICTEGNTRQVWFVYTRYAAHECMHVCVCVCIHVYVCVCMLTQTPYTHACMMTKTDAHMETCAHGDVRTCVHTYS